MKARWSIAGLLFICFSVFILLFNWPKFSSGLSNLIGWPVSKFYQFGATVRMWSNLAKIADENDQLRALVAATVVDYVSLSRLQNENTALRQELNFIRDKKVNLILAKVIGREILNRSAIIIDRGQQHGIAIGQVATVNGGIVIGKVIEVFSDRSVVLLLTDPRSQLAVTPATTSNGNGLVIGQTSNALLLDFVPQITPLKENDLIVTSGLENSIPAGLLVGKVGLIISKENDVFKQARLIIPVNYDGVENVSIVVGNYVQSNH
jgi:rod shape-determining protein MreC